MIFKKLDFKSRKSATEVCKRWSKIAFIPKCTQIFLPERARDSKSFTKLLKNTQRIYVNMRADLALVGTKECDDLSQKFEAAFKLLEKSLKSLHIAYSFNTSCDFIKLSDCLQKIKNLESLKLEAHISCNSLRNNDELPILINLKKLELLIYNGDGRQQLLED